MRAWPLDCRSKKYDNEIIYCNDTVQLDFGKDLSSIIHILLFILKNTSRNHCLVYYDYDYWLRSKIYIQTDVCRKLKTVRILLFVYVQ